MCGSVRNPEVKLEEVWVKTSAACENSCIPLTQTPAQSLPQHWEADTHIFPMRKSLPLMVQDMVLTDMSCFNGWNITPVIALTEHHMLQCWSDFFHGPLSHWWYKVWQLGTLLSSLYNLLRPRFVDAGKELAVLLSTAVCQGPPCHLLQGSDPLLGRSEEQWGHHYLPLSEQSTEETLFEETENHKQLLADESHRRMLAATSKEDSRTKKLGTWKHEILNLCQSTISMEVVEPLICSSQYWRGTL